MISAAPKGIVMNPRDILYAALMIVVFLLIEYGLARMKRGPRLRAGTEKLNGPR